MSRAIVRLSLLILAVWMIVAHIGSTIAEQAITASF